MVEGVMRRNPGNPWRFVTAGLIALISAATTYVATIRAADATYQLVENWAQLPAGTKWETMTAVDIDSKGTIYVFQRGEPSKIMAFDSKGKLLRSWGDGMFPSAHGLRVDRQDNVWITDRVLHQVMKFSPQGKLLMELGAKGVKGDNDSRDALNGPSDVVIGPNGDISNDVGNVKAHLPRSGRRSRLSSAKERADAAVACRRFSSGVHLQAPNPGRVTSRRCCPPNISSVTPDHDDVYELPAREGGG
jgi:hypothetical protein